MTEHALPTAEMAVLCRINKSLCDKSHGHKQILTQETKKTDQEVCLASGETEAYLQFGTRRLFSRLLC